MDADFTQCPFFDDLKVGGGYVVKTCDFTYTPEDPSLFANPKAFLACNRIQMLTNDYIRIRAKVTSVSSTTVSVEYGTWDYSRVGDFKCTIVVIANSIMGMLSILFC